MQFISTQHISNLSGIIQQPMLQQAGKQCREHRYPSDYGINAARARRAVLRIIYRIKIGQYNSDVSCMSQRAKAIVIPQAHPFQRYYKQQEQAKTYFETRLFIAPNRESRPLGLPSKQPADLPYDQRFLPSFDNFSLPALFANALLTQAQLADFKREQLGSSDVYQTPARKKHQNLAFKDTDEASRHYATEAKKSRPRQKGLRQLSQRAYEIVLTLRSASYKEVANKLVDQLNHQKEADQLIMRSRIEEKDEQNIKRRVYDALNVLIALGVLRKEGRKIVGDRSIQLRFEESDKRLLQTEIEAKQQQISQKKEELRKCQAKLSVLPSLIQANRQMPEGQRRVDFPFMVLKGEEPDFKLKQFDQLGNLVKFQLRSSESANIRMDLDVYTEYQLHHRV